MKIAAATILFVIGATTDAFSPQSTARRQSSSLNLFGGGGGEKKAGGPGMMDQLAMFKKAQEIAKKKNDLDKELQEQDFMGNGADGKVKASFKFIPVKNPMDPNPDYEAQKFEFDGDWYEGATPEEISAAVKEAIEDGMKTANDAVAVKYQTLQGDIVGMAGATVQQPPAGGEDGAAAE